MTEQRFPDRYERSRTHNKKQPIGITDAVKCVLDATSRFGLVAKIARPFWKREQIFMNLMPTTAWDWKKSPCNCKPSKNHKRKCSQNTLCVLSVKSINT